MSLFKWSRTAADNANADSSINFREGQGPSSINNSARALMAAAAMYRDDLSGVIATGGSSTAYTVASYQSFDALTDGLVVAFAPHTTNGNNPTLNVDSRGAKPLRSQTGQALGAGVLIQGSPYTAVYRLSADEWLLFGFYSDPVPAVLGSPLPYVGDTAPNSNFALCYGQAISRTTYASLFALTSTTFGSGDGSTTFNLPDLRGRAIFGKDDLGGSAANRITNAGSGITGTTKGATGGAQNVALTTAQLASHTHTGTTDSGGAHSHTYTAPANASGGDGGSSVVDTTTSGTTSTDGAHTHGFTTAASGSGDAHNNMPPCIILPYIIRVL